MRLDDPARILRFAGVGLVSTALYAALAFAFTARGGLAPALASLLAYAAGSVFTYLAHRRITFRSSDPHGPASVRFAGFAASGYAVALVAPLVLIDGAGLPPAVAVAFVSLAVPLMNFVLMPRLVFTDARRPSARGSRQ